MAKYITEAFARLNEDADINAPVVAKKAHTVAKIDDGGDLNKKLLDKIDAIARLLSARLAEEGIENDRTTPEFIKQDMIRDCGIMGGVISTDTLDTKDAGDALTKSLAQSTPIPPQMACDLLLNITPEEYVDSFINSLRNGRARLSGPTGMLPTRGPSRILPYRGRRYIESLAESYLIEGENLDKIYDKYYAQAFKKPDFERIIALDPTYNAEEDKMGRYGQWLLTRYRKKQLSPADMRVATEVLNDFNDRKQYLNNDISKGPGKEANKGIDINAYTSVAEVRAALDCIELTQNQIAAKNRKAKHHADLGDEAKFIAETDKWEIWSPKTYNASCKLGSGTTWCTASTSNDHWFHHYADNGNLYIFIDKTEQNHKIQLHIDRNNRVTDFKDGKTDAAWRRGVDRFEGFTVFITEEGLKDVLKKTEIGICDAFLEAENLDRVSRGEPYIYAGGKVPSNFKSVVKIIEFAEGYLPEKIDPFAFDGCEKLEKITLPKSIKTLGYACFRGCPDTLVIEIPRSVKQLSLSSEDRAFIASKIKRID